MRSYKISPFLWNTPSKGLIYHALFGNLSRVSPRIQSLLVDRDKTFPEGYLQEMIGSENIAHLHRLFFLISEGEDERKITEQWLQERRSRIDSGYYFQTLQISASNLCNYACAYCFADASDGRSPIRTKISKESPTLSIDTAIKGIDALLENSSRHGRVSTAIKFLGREPLVNWKTIKIILARYHNVAIDWSITTNGSLITEEIAETLAAYHVRVVVSLDGPSKTNDKLRIFKDGEGTFDSTVRGLRILREKKVTFSISSVISEYCSIDHYKRFIVDMIQFGVNDFELTLAMQTRALKPHDAFGGKDSLIIFLKELFIFGIQQGVSIHGDWADPFYRIRSTSYQRGDPELLRPLGAGCSASEHQLSLESSGDVFPCRAMSTHYGHMSDLESVFKSTEYESVIMRTFFNVPMCHGCKLEGHCQGTCLGSCEEESGKVYHPQREYCEIYRSVTDILLETSV